MIEWEDDGFEAGEIRRLQVGTIASQCRLRRNVGPLRLLLAYAGGRTPDAWAVRSDVATDRDVAASSKLTTDRKAGKSNR